MIIKAQELTAEEMARRSRLKVTRQGLVENEPVIPAFKLVRNPFYFHTIKTLFYLKE